MSFSIISGHKESAISRRKIQVLIVHFSSNLCTQLIVHIWRIACQIKRPLSKSPHVQSDKSWIGMFICKLLVNICLVSNNYFLHYFLYKLQEQMNSNVYSCHILQLHELTFIFKVYILLPQPLTHMGDLIM